MLLNTIPVFMTLFGFCSTALALDPSVSGLVKRAVTLDGTCGFTGGGSGKNYTCGSTKPCCSRFGYCGSDSGYCQTGCQKLYGQCDDTPTATDLWVCGPQNNNLICVDPKCCSKYGYCGTSDAHCGTGCQSAFGKCVTASTSSTSSSSTSSSTSSTITSSSTSFKTSSTVASSSTSTSTSSTTTSISTSINTSSTVTSTSTSTSTSSTAIPTSTNGRCGTNFNTRCATGECCSGAGWCGVDIYCRSPDCQRDYGRCDADLMPAGASTTDVPRPKIGNVPYGQIINSCTGSPRAVALTYDDGPLDYTNDMLDLLKAYNFKATFFVSGVNFHKGQIDDESTPWPAAIRRAYAEGHQIASHSWSHADLSTNITDARRLEEMIKPEMALRNIMGKFPTYMRPPYIECNAACLALMDKLGYHVIYFDLNTRDYLYITPDTNQVAKDIVHDYLIQQGVQEYLSILHDVHWQTVHNLSVYMFDEMVRGNWKGTTVGDCLNDPVENWYRTP